MASINIETPNNQVIVTVTPNQMKGMYQMQEVEPFSMTPQGQTRMGKSTIQDIDHNEKGFYYLVTGMVKFVAVIN